MKKMMVLIGMVFAFGATAMAAEVLTCQSAGPLKFSVTTPEGKADFSDVTQFTYQQNGNRNYSSLIIAGRNVAIDSYSRSRKGVQISISGWQTPWRISLNAVRSSAPISIGSETAYAAYEGSVVVSQGQAVNVRCRFEVK